MRVTRMNYISLALSLSACLFASQLWAQKLISFSATPTEQTITLNWQFNDPAKITDLKIYRLGAELPVDFDQRHELMAKEGELITGRESMLEPRTASFVDDNALAHYQYFYALHWTEKHSRKAHVSQRVITALVDRTSPASVELLEANAIDKRHVELTWQASSSPDVVAYRIYRQRADVQSRPGLVRIINLSEKTKGKQKALVSQKENAGIAYRYSVMAVDGAGNLSELSNKRQVMLPHTLLPIAPIGLQVKEQDSKGEKVLTLTWQPVANAKQYRVYRNLSEKDAAFELLHTVNAEQLAYRDTKVTALTAYRYRVAAVDQFANESRATRGKLVRTKRAARSLDPKEEPLEESSPKTKGEQR